MPAIRRYRVTASQYYEGRGEGFRDALQRCEAPMRQLVARYGLAGKSILSIGAGDAWEERWFNLAGCNLVLVDISEVIGGHLASLPAAAEADSDAFDYIVGDAADYIQSGDAAFDVLYVSSFHPDEVRRETLQAGHGWPAGENPYHSTLMQATALLAPSGLAIFQHYKGGVNVAVNRHYLDDVQRQFGDHGLALVEAHAFHDSPEHLLVVAIKGSPADGGRYALTLSMRPPITEFHGRYPGPERKCVIRAFLAGGVPVHERARAYLWRARHSLSSALRSRF